MPLTDLVWTGVASKRDVESLKNPNLRTQVYHWNLLRQSYVRKIIFFFIFLKSFHLFLKERERDRAWAGEEQREREAQNLKLAPGSELSAQSLTDMGLELTNCEIMTWAEVRRLTNWATQAPRLSDIVKG